jgi:hypothetical protein
MIGSILQPYPNKNANSEYVESVFPYCYTYQTLKR